jgi:hypothetical protein
MQNEILMQDTPNRIVSVQVSNPNQTADLWSRAQYKHLKSDEKTEKVLAKEIDHICFAMSS